MTAYARSSHAYRVASRILMKRWKLAILIFELVLFRAILVLPEVALPDLSVDNGSEENNEIQESATGPPKT